jgi:L-cysteine/cystine lyase
LVDAAQSVGVLPLNLVELDVDFYAFTGHKWWCGPAGLGGLYVRSELLEDLRPTYVGWRGVTRNSAGYPTGYQPDGRRFEVATSDCALYAGLQAAIATHHLWGTAEQRYQRIKTVSQYLWEQLSKIPSVTCLRTTPPESGLVSFQIDRSNPASVVQSLESQGFLLRTILDPVCIRACVHYFTLESEIDRLVAALSQII